jgi:SAM-dependent methyltransferase
MTGSAQTTPRPRDRHGAPPRWAGSSTGRDSRLPLDSFDVVTAFNAFQFSADFAAALAEAARVTRSGGRVAVCNWGRVSDYEFPGRATLERALTAIAPACGVAAEVAERVARKTVEIAAEPFRRPDGSYRFENRFRYLIAVAA